MRNDIRQDLRDEQSRPWFFIEKEVVRLWERKHLALCRADLEFSGV